MLIKIPLWCMFLRNLMYTQICFYIESLKRTAKCSSMEIRSSGKSQRRLVQQLFAVYPGLLLPKQ